MFSIDDDRVVHDEAGRDRQGHQREVVDAVAEQVHDAEGADERDRHGDARDERRAHSRAGRGRRPGSRAAIEISSVICTSWTEARIVRVASIATERWIAGGIAAWKLRQQRRDAVDRLDDVGARLPEDDEQDRGLAVGEAARADVLDRVGDGRDVGEAHGRAVLVVDDEGPVLGGLQELVGRARATRPGRRRRPRPSGGWRWPSRGPCGRPRGRGP